MNSQTKSEVLLSSSTQNDIPLPRKLRDWFVRERQHRPHSDQLTQATRPDLEAEGPAISEYS